MRHSVREHRGETTIEPFASASGDLVRGGRHVVATPNGRRAPDGPQRILQPVEQRLERVSENARLTHRHLLKLRTNWKQQVCRKLSSATVTVSSVASV